VTPRAPVWLGPYVQCKSTAGTRIQGRRSMSKLARVQNQGFLEDSSVHNTSPPSPSLCLLLLSYLPLPNLFLPIFFLPTSLSSILSSSTCSIPTLLLPSFPSPFLATPSLPFSLSPFGANPLIHLGSIREYGERCQQTVCGAFWTKRSPSGDSNFDCTPILRCASPQN